MKIDASLIYPFIILIVTIIAAIAAFWSNVQSNRQLNRMEEYDSLNLKLGKEIKYLSDINNQISTRIDTIVAENRSLTQHNIQLTNKANELIEEVEKLTTTSNELIKKASAENALTGILDFQYDKPLEDSETLIVRAGGVEVGNNVRSLKSNNPPGYISIGGRDLIPIKIVDGKLKVSITIYDIYGNLIVEIENNVWYRYANNSGKFNYDSKGFEVVDNQGLTALSINLDSRTEVSIEGYFYDRKTGNIYIYGGNRFQAIPIFRPAKNIIEKIEKANIRQMFEYSGNNWIGKRRTE
ncbi:uncharacterized membrane-anchored protein YhcB (DUF1043 family) [Catalinimonas alkaloidigena]|uniref:hypothetical protein n=1 Tax=Catalinimonas alkaloidigena TaxID=1075417 RepID=UPI002406ECB8|nr:hypothetical protein [Catalinimonas alkaloidigena]MDF9798619.1 uncharacterized membrane-anchored protein YhcB (DUF1043 family) [Catalinimonas alkaloidigena]